MELRLIDLASYRFVSVRDLIRRRDIRWEVCKWMFYPNLKAKKTEPARIGTPCYH
jgi:hypothetical protein